MRGFSGSIETVCLIRAPKKLAVNLADTGMGRRILLRNSASFVPVFMFHRFRTPDDRVVGHDPALVVMALDYLRTRGFQVMTIDDVLQGQIDQTLPRQVVAFTMDDGYREQGVIGAEIFLAHECPVTIYLATGAIDGQYWPMEAKVAYLFSQVKQEFSLSLRGREVIVPANPADIAVARRRLVNELKDYPLHQTNLQVEALAMRLGVELAESPPPEYRSLTWAEVSNLEARGVSFGGHTVRHATLSAETDEVSWREIEACTRTLAARVRRPSKVFCYPTGRSRDYGDREVAYLKELGYLGAASAEPGYCAIDNDANSHFNIRRFSFPDNLLDFKDIVLQLPRLRQRIRPWKG
jgi:peptidoglycan/xylan/chitin deacetylase (PgdA/CDA1 family)